MLGPRFHHTHRQAESVACCCFLLRGSLSLVDGVIQQNHADNQQAEFPSLPLSTDGSNYVRYQMPHYRCLKRAFMDPSMCISNRSRYNEQQPRKAISDPANYVLDCHICMDSHSGAGSDRLRIHLHCRITNHENGPCLVSSRHVRYRLIGFSNEGKEFRSSGIKDLIAQAKNIIWLNCMLFANIRAKAQSYRIYIPTRFVY